MHGALTQLSIQEFGCAALWSLGQQSTGIAARIGCEGGISAVLQAMDEHPCEKNVQEEGCYALCVLAADNANGEKIGLEGGISAVLGAMRAHRSAISLQEQAVAALRNLSVNINHAIKIGADGGVEMIVHAMQSCSEDAVAQEHACGALRNVAIDATNAVRAVKAKAVAMILSAMERFRTEVNLQEEACGALRNLAWHEQACAHCVCEESLLLVVKCMQIHRSQASMQEQACATLRVMAEHDISVVQNITGSAACPVKSVMDIMIEHTENLHVQHEACSAMCTMVENSAKCRSRLGSLDGISIMSQVLAAFAGDKHINAMALRVFDQLNRAKNDPNSSESGQATRPPKNATPANSENTQLGNRHKESPPKRAQNGLLSPVHETRQSKSLSKAPKLRNKADQNRTIGDEEINHVQNDGVHVDNQNTSSSQATKNSNHAAQNLHTTKLGSTNTTAHSTSTVSPLARAQANLPIETYHAQPISASTATHARAAQLHKSGSTISCADTVAAADRTSARSNSPIAQDAGMHASCMKDCDTPPASSTEPMRGTVPRPLPRQSSLELLRKARADRQNQ